MNKKMNLEYSSALLNLAEANPSFDLGTLRVAYTGKNRNRTFISKKTFERAIHTIYGCPVVANYIRDIDEIGSHDGEFITDKDGNVDYVYITQPVGFVPPNATWKWEEVEDDGVLHQYLTTEVVLWKRQEAYSKIKENGITAQSMEITVTDGEMCDDYYEINDFYFTAFCLLGLAEPCFESASLATFNYKPQFDNDLSEMLSEFKKAFAADERFFAKEGNEKNMNKLEILLEQYNVSLDEVTFNVEGLSDDELEAAFGEAFADTPAEPESESETQFELECQFRDRLWESIINAEKIETDYGSYSRYWPVDYDHITSGVYYIDNKDDILYGSTYTLDGDNIVIDFENKTRKKWAIVDFIDGEETFALDEYVKTICDVQIEGIRAAYTEMEANYQTLVNQENKRLANEVLEKFESALAGEAKFEALKTSDETFDLTDLENKLFSMVGRKQFELNNSGQRPSKAPVLPKGDTSDEPYGDLFDFMKK